MARRGWMNASVSAPPWWRRAIFYRIDPTRFQASGSASTGDLAGITLRLDYLQSLGVDALVLEPSARESAAPVAALASAVPAAPFDPDALESLIREAGRHNLRVLPALPPALAYGDRTLLLRTVHEWLGEGAAGIALPNPPSQVVLESPSQVLPAAANAGAAAYLSLVALLEDTLRATPGDRVLLTGPVGNALPSGGAEDHPQAMARIRKVPLGKGSGRLTTAAIVPAAPATAAVLRSALVSLPTSDAGAASPGGTPLLRLVASPAGNGSGLHPLPAAQNEVAAAAVLLASRAAALFDFGAEIGLNTEASEAGAHDTTGPAPLMQWTPTNIQRAPIERVAPALPAPGQPTPIGPYKPFVRPPPRSLTGNVPGGPAVDLDRNLPPPLPDPDTLPGFTAGTLPVLPVDGTTLNVATEDRDPGSVLNAFRDLLVLRRGQASLREGTQVVLNHDAQNALVLLRRPPAGGRTAGTVVVAANLGSAPTLLSLDADLLPLGLHPGPLRALFSYGPQALTGESTATLRLPPHAVFVGELR